MRVFAAVVLLLGLAVAAFGQSPGPTPLDERQILIGDGQTGGSAGQFSQQNLESFGIFDFLRMILVLALVVGAIYAVFHFLKKMNAPKPRESSIIKVLDSQALSGTRGIHLVELGTHLFLIGTGDSSVNMLQEITDKESVDEIRLKAEKQAESVGAKRFGEVLSDLFRKVGQKPPQQGIANPQGADFIRQQKDRIRKL